MSHIDIWYGMIGLVFLFPYFISTNHFVNYLNRNDQKTRNELPISCLYVIASQTLLSIWNNIYLWVYYNPDDDDSNFQREYRWTQTKRTMMIVHTFTSIFVNMFYFMFYYIALQYSEKRRLPDEIKDN